MTLLVVLALLQEKPEQIVATAVKRLLACQEAAGTWSYEGVYRVKGEIPVGYRVGGTSVVAGALLAAAPEEKEVAAAVEKGLSAVLKDLGDPLMETSTVDAYDVRVWGHACALEFLCRLRAAKRLPKEGAEWIPKLRASLVEEQLKDGGWNYASRRAHAPFVTAPVVQALLLAKSQGEEIAPEVFAKARKALEGSRQESGVFRYSGTGPSKEELPGSIARSAGCETTLLLLGGGSVDAARKAVAAFHEHWGELEKRRKKTGTHVPPYQIAPYYVYYGHRYAAQAIEMLPEKERAPEREKLLQVILKTRDEDGTWNDRVFDRSKAYGTAEIVLALLGAKSPGFPALEKK